MPKDSGSGHDRRLLFQPGVCPHGLTGGTRVRPVAARCHRAEWTVSCDSPSVVRNDSRTATLVRFEHPCTGRRPLLLLLALSRARRRALSHIRQLFHTKTRRCRARRRPCPLCYARALPQPKTRDRLRRWRHIFVSSCEISFALRRRDGRLRNRPPQSAMPPNSHARTVRQPPQLDPQRRLAAAGARGWRRWSRLMSRGWK